MIKVDQQTKRLFSFILERQLIFLRRRAGEPKPWTKDLILQQYRFCNVYRENDTVTQWIARYWRTPHKADRELWFAMTVARLLNLPDSLMRTGWPIPWQPKSFALKLHRMQKEGFNTFNAAYIVSTNGLSMDKVDYVAQNVLTPLWKAREKINAVIHNETLGTIPPPTLQNIHDVLTQFNGLGSFLSAQIIADLKYVKPYLECADWHTFAASGPGSRRGLSRIIGLEVDAPWREREWHNCLMELQKKINHLIERQKFASDAPITSPLHAQDLQNCLCEFDKYERVRLNQGRPKQLFQGA